MIEEVPYPREGIAFVFTGHNLDQDGEATGELIRQELIVPPLNFHALRRLNAPSDTTPSEEKLCKALEYALRRNYNGVPRWLIEQTVDLGNMGDFNKALMDTNGVWRQEIEEKKAQAAKASTGTASTST